MVYQRVAHLHSRAIVVGMIMVIVSLVSWYFAGDDIQVLGVAAAMNVFAGFGFLETLRRFVSVNRYTGLSASIAGIFGVVFCVYKWQRPLVDEKEHTNQRRPLIFLTGLSVVLLTWSLAVSTMQCPPCSLGPPSALWQVNKDEPVAAGYLDPGPLGPRHAVPSSVHLPPAPLPYRPLGSVDELPQAPVSVDSNSELTVAAGYLDPGPLGPRHAVPSSVHLPPAQLPYRPLRSVDELLQAPVSVDSNSELTDDGWI